MYELNKLYGWKKFIVVVPSVAIREGIHKSFQITQDHFAEDYGKKIRYFIYDSKNLTAIDHPLQIADQCDDYKFPSFQRSGERRQAYLHEAR